MAKNILGMFTVGIAGNFMLELLLTIESRNEIVMPGHDGTSRRLKSSLASFDLYNMTPTT